SGTIVLGSDVQISSVAVAQGSLAIRFNETPQVSQPNPFSQNGETIVVPRTDIAVDDKPKNIALLRPNVTLSDLVSGLNALGVSPREMIDILKAIKAAGALHAELVVQ
ncbi:MAG: flagellar basal body P-ring protein FlgI, partial [Parvularculaceae bacterium]|nr:flagellar basal body P-ring protein FlgI [Parvularculaceae bacterium]